MTRALLQQALDALEGCYDVTHNSQESTQSRAVTAIRAHLAQSQGEPLFADLIAQHDGLAEELAAMDKPQGEPVAWMYESDGYLSHHPAAGKVPLYLHPAHTEAEVQQILSYTERSAGVEEVVRYLLGVPAP